MDRILVNPQRLAERLAVWADEARHRGRVERADRLLGLAWIAYDSPRGIPVVDALVHPAAPMQASSLELMGSVHSALYLADTHI